MMAQLCFFLVKSPFIVYLTFHVDATNIRIDQEADREIRRQEEIQEAIERRKERDTRKRLREGNQNIPMATLPKVIVVKEYKPKSTSSMYELSSASKY